MAKQLVSPVERHLEKGVLGITVIVLLAVIAMYLVTSPNQRELGGEWVSPKDIDEKVEEKARVVRQRLRDHEPPESDFEPLYEDFVAAMDPFGQAGLVLEASAVLSIGPEVPMVDKTIVKAGQKSLVDIVPVTNPVAVVGRSTFHVDPEALDGGDFLPANWVTVSAVFNVKEQMERQLHEYGAKREEVLFAKVEVQRRARRNDGSWSDDDWALIQPWPADRLRNPPEVRLVEDEQEGMLVVDRGSRLALDQYFRGLSEPATQLGLIRPLPHDVRDGTPWTVPALIPRRELLLMDYDYYPNEAPEDPLDDRYPDAPDVSAVEEEEQETPQQLIQRKLQAAEDYLRAARNNCSGDDALRGYNEAFEVSRDGNANRRDKMRAERLMRESDQLVADIKRGKLPSCRPGGAGPGEETDRKRERRPAQQMWVHDGAQGSLEGGRTYQYRLRVWLYNRLAGEPEKFADSADARKVLIPGPWSEPTEPVALEPGLFYFLTNSDESKDDIRVEVFRWFEGVWVKHAWKFAVGSLMAESDREPVPGLGGADVEYPTITFDTGATVLDIDYQRLYRGRSRAGRAGVSFGQPSPTCVAVFVDSEGRLHERVLPIDKGHPAKGALLKDRVFKPARTRRGP